MCSWPSRLSTSSLSFNLVLPAQTHQTTGHTNYSGPMVDLTEALTSLPSGGQCIMSGQTFRRVVPQLQSLTEDRMQNIKVHITALPHCMSQHHLAMPLLSFALSLNAIQVCTALPNFAHALSFLMTG